MTNCPYCNSERVRKNGTNRGTQRMKCAECGKTFPLEPRRISKEIKQKALMMYLNNVGIRKIALIFNVSPTSVLRWIRNAHKLLTELIKNFNPLSHDKTDIIELDEIYTYVNTRKKRPQYGLLILEEESVLLRMSSDRD